MQNVCVGEKHARFFQYNNSDLLHEVNKVIDANENNLVIYIKNVMKKNLINKFAPFHAYEGTEDVDFAKELHIVSDNIFIKYKGNAFTNSGLDILLKKHNIEYVEVVGVDLSLIHIQMCIRDSFMAAYSLVIVKKYEEK